MAATRPEWTVAIGIPASAVDRFPAVGQGHVKRIRPSYFGDWLCPGSTCRHASVRSDLHLMRIERLKALYFQERTNAWNWGKNVCSMHNLPVKGLS